MKERFRNWNSDTDSCANLLITDTVTENRRKFHFWNHGETILCIKNDYNEISVDAAIDFDSVSFEGLWWTRIMKTVQHDTDFSTEIQKQVSKIEINTNEKPKLLLLSVVSSRITQPSWSTISPLRHLCTSCRCITSTSSTLLWPTAW